MSVATYTERKIDRWLVGMGILTVLVCLWLIFFGDRYLFSKTSDQPLFGTVTKSVGDTRHRVGGELSWYQGRAQQEIRLGDALFVGERSEAEVSLLSGSQLKMEPNTMVVFTEVRGFKVLNLIDGSLSLPVNGSMKLAVRGELTELHSLGGRLQISARETGKAKFKVLQGQAQVRTSKTGLIELAQNGKDAWELPLSGHTETLAQSEGSEVPAEALPTVETPKPYYWKLYDYYEARGYELKERETKPVISNVVPQFLAWAPDTVGPDSVTIKGREVRVPLEFQAPEIPIGFVVELSANESFVEAQTQRVYLPARSLHVAIRQPGFYHYRVRAVGANQELSEWSQAHRVEAKRWQSVVVPRVAQVEPDPLPQPEAPPPPPVEEPQRGPAEETKIATKVETPTGPSPNSSFKLSEFTLEGLAWGFQSTEQASAGGEVPSVVGLGLKALKWWNKNGVSASLRSAVTGLNDAGSNVSPKQVQVSYYRRFFTGFPFGWARELQTSLFGGAEIYRSSGSDFSTQYNLVRLGLGLDFPLAHHWSTGGYFAYGLGLDSSKKMELSGHLNYHFNPRWSLGGGYRLSLFQAGSLDSAAGRLPFREGYTEGITTLNYHY